MKVFFLVLMLKLAKEAKSESIFQQKAQYIKFKAKKNGHRSEIMGWIDVLSYDLEFRHECIFWCHKLLEERVCDKDEKCRMLYALSSTYYRIENFENTIEFGQKLLVEWIIRQFLWIQKICWLPSKNKVADENLHFQRHKFFLVKLQRLVLELLFISYFFLYLEGNTFNFS